MLRLDFSASDLNLPANREKTRRASISGVQDKVQLKRVRGGFAVVESGDDYVLKPVPRNTHAELASDIPANKALTMDIAEKVFLVREAEVREMISLFLVRRDAASQMIATSRLSDEARSRYLSKFADRLKAIAQ